MSLKKHNNIKEKRDCFIYSNCPCILGSYVLGSAKYKRVVPYATPRAPQKNAVRGPLIRVAKSAGELVCVESRGVLDPFNLYAITDFVEIQRKSFFTLLEKGIIEEFSKRNPICNQNKTLELFFYPSYYQLTPPEYTKSLAICRSKSYTSKLYIPVQLTDKISKTITLKWVYIGDIPLMTKRGHFILNGCARVIVNQMIRSPGIYYQKKNYDVFSDKWTEKPQKSFTRYYADIICNRGTWLRIEIDKSNKIWAQMKRVPKIPIMWFLIGAGLTEKMVLKSIMDSQLLLSNQGVPRFYTGLGKYEPFLKVKKVLPYVKTPPAAWVNIYNLVFAKKTTTLKENNKKKKDSPGASAHMGNKNRGAQIPSHIEKIRDTGKAAKIKKEGVNNDAVFSLNTALSSQTGVKAELGRKWLFNKFMNPRTYDLGTVGRLNINNKLKLSIKTDLTTLTPHDFLAATNHLILVSKGLRELDDIDHLKNRRVRTAGEQLQVQIGIGLVRLEKHLREKLTTSIKMLPLSTKNSRQTRLKGMGPSIFVSWGPQIPSPLHSLPLSLPPYVPSYRVRSSYRVGKLEPNPTGKKGNLTDSPGPYGPSNHQARLKSHIKAPLISRGTITLNNLMNTKPFNGALREFFGTNPLSQFMDQINPLAELTHKRRLSSMGTGGVTRDSATLEIRGIHPSHYGRICPVETPEGKNTGLVNSLTAYARVNSEGYIETPFYRVYKGQVQKKVGLYFVSAKEEEKLKIGAADLSTSDIGFLHDASIPVRAVEKFTFLRRKEMQFVGVAPIQMISIATSLIPFFEHDDANRALMGSNMQRQAVPIVKPQRPIVGTGLEARAVSDSGHAVTANKSGFVFYTSATKIIVLKR